MPHACSQSPRLLTRNHLGNVIAALSISGPQRKIGTPQEREFIHDVVKAAALVSSKLGYLEVKGGR